MYEPIALVTLGAPALTGAPGVKNQALSYHLYCPVSYTHLTLPTIYSV